MSGLFSAFSSAILQEVSSHRRGCVLVEEVVCIFPSPPGQKNTLHRTRWWIIKTVHQDETNRNARKERRKNKKQLVV